MCNLCGNLWRMLSTLSALAAYITPGLGDGGFFGKFDLGRRAMVSSPGQQAVILRDGTSHEILLLQTTYRGSSADFAWVIPVPGRPAREDVFLANPNLMVEVEQRTRPQTRTILRDPLAGSDRSRSYQRAGMGPGLPAGPGGPGSEAAPKVIIHERMEVGDYDVSVLSATGHGVLVSWLNQNGYAFPRHAGPLVDDYVARRWTFVALRIRPQVQRTQAMLRDVAPIGIRFPTEKLVYPLTLSKVSAPDVTTLLLLVLDNAGVECAELPTVMFPPETKPKPQSTYYQLARSLLAKHSSRAFLCEAQLSFTLGRYDPLSSVTLRKDGGPRIPLTRGMITRLWAELPREAMKDLTLVRASASEFSLYIEKAADLPTPVWAYFFGTRIAHFLWTALAFALVLIALWPRRVTKPQHDVSVPLRRAWWCSLGVLVAVVAILLLPATKHLSDYGLHDWPEWLTARVEAVVAAQTLLCIWILPAFFLIRDLRRRVPPDAETRAVPWFLLLMALALAVRLMAGPDYGIQIDSGALGVLFAVLSLIGLALLCWPLAIMLARRVEAVQRSLVLDKALALGLLSLVVLIPVVRRLCDRAVANRPDQYDVMRQENEAMTRLETALRMFRDATGAFPRRLRDLAGTDVPSVGLDVGGNEVAITGAPPMPLLPALPVDPLTNRNDTWLYDVRSPVLVESGAYEVTVMTQQLGTGRWGP